MTILVGGGFFIANGTLEPIALATYALYINIFITPIEVLVEFTEMLQKGYSGFKRFNEVMETAVDIKDEPGSVDLKDVKGVIDYKDVSFSYDGEETVLDHINIHIDAGRSIALVGPSGGGKTTICSLLPRFYDVSSGSIQIDGKDIRGLTLKSLRQAIGIVQQDVYLFSGSIRDNISYGDRNASEEQIIEAAKKANIHEFIMSLPDGYDTYVGERGTRLSGGQKQRIPIALDNESERHIQKSLEELAKNRTCITIAHRLSTIRGADEIIVIGEKGIEERGTHEELLKENNIYARYYRLQFEGLEE